jgi:anaerobic magnesium-protoporphyrin IX monomethyl ester cyclase
VVNSPLFRELNPLYDEDSLPPIGLGYIATAVEQAGMTAMMVDAVADRIGLAALVQRTKELRPRAIGINVFTTNYELVREYVENIGDVCGHVIVGGLATRTLHSSIFNWAFDGQLDVILGDGERIVVSLLNGTVDEPAFAAAIRRRFFRIDGQSKYHVSDLDTVPLNRGFFSNEPVRHPRGFSEANIVASRGCIYNCAFCAAARSLNKDVDPRVRSVESLRAELDEIRKRYPGVTSVRVLDDLFLKTARCIDRAASVFEGSGLKWRSMAHVMTFQGATVLDIGKLRVSGCDELFIGIESGSERVLRQIRKTHDIGRILANLDRVMEAGISIKGYFIYGFPGETAEDMEKTYQLALALKRMSLPHGVEFRTSVFQFRPYHGTELHQQMVDSGTPPQAVLQIAPDAKLSDLVGRLQFNFHSGDYSAESGETVRQYIYKTANLTAKALWGLGAEDDVAGVPQVRAVQEPAAARPRLSGPA